MRINSKFILIVFLIVLFSGLLARHLQRAGKRNYCDFRVYYHTAQVFLNKGDIYLRDKEEITPFKYSPFFAFLVCPLGFISIKSAAALFFAINFLATIALLYWSKKLLIDEPLGSLKTFFLYFLTVLFTGRFILQVWDSGQVNIIMCALVVMSLYSFSKQKDILGALLLSLALLFKYTPAIFIPYLIFKRRFKAVGFIAIFTVLYLMLPALYVGAEKAFEYLCSWIPSVISTSLDQSSYIDFKNQSIYSMIIRFFSPTEYHVNFLQLNFFQAKILGYAVAFILYLTAFIRSSQRTSKEDYYDVALLFICLPLFNPNAWMINFVALIFPYMALMYYLMKTSRKNFFIIACVALAFILTSWMSEDLVGNALESFAEVVSSVTVGTLFLYAALVKLKFFNNRKVIGKSL